MSNPELKAARLEISQLFDPLTPSPVFQNIPYLPLMLRGESPVVSTEDRGFRSFLASANPGMYDLSYAVVVRVNRDAHGAEAAQDIFDNVREAIINIIVNTTGPINFEALEIPNGQFGPVFLEIHDGIQYIVGEIPVIARDVVCKE